MGCRAGDRTRGAIACGDPLPAVTQQEFRGDLRAVAAADGEDRQLLMPATAADEFSRAMVMRAGPIERARGLEFMKRVTIVDNNSSARVMALTTSNRLGYNDKLIFGTADKYGVLIYTGDRDFLSAAAHHGVRIFARSHDPVSFTGQ
ncbi:DUF1308 domain-containing protein [Embleya sp. NPDC005575]|uniref:DUF1308 domain-containing protein n=1 Tax=Embleya sp. NPDC005575 TaxID=3156892 RepID=UPI0033AF8AF1